MKLLRIENNLGYYRAEDGAYHEIDKITKEALLWILEMVLDNSGELDEYNEYELKNQAHQVVYKSIYSNLRALEDRRQEFIDESERLFLEDYKRYAEDKPLPQQYRSDDTEDGAAEG